MLLSTQSAWEAQLALADGARNDAVKATATAVHASRRAHGLSSNDAEVVAAAMADAEALYSLAIGADDSAFIAESGIGKVGFNLRPAVSIMWAGKVFTADIVMAFVLPASPPWSLADGAATTFTEPHFLVQWHKELKSFPHPFPCNVCVLDEQYTIVAWDAVINQVLVVPQLGPIPPSVLTRTVVHSVSGTGSRVAQHRVVAFCSKDVLHCG